MGSGLAPLSLKITTTRHLALLGGTIYSALYENLPIPTTKTCKIFNITNCPFEWKGTLTVKAPTVNLSGHRLLWTAGEPCGRQSKIMKSARDLLPSGPLEY